MVHPLRLGDYRLMRHESFGHTGGDRCIVFGRQAVSLCWVDVTRTSRGSRSTTGSRLSAFLTQGGSGSCRYDGA